MLVISPQSPFFKNTLGLPFSLVFFSSVFPFNIPCFFSSTPFEVIFSFCFFGSMFVAPFLSSFLLLSFQPVSCHLLLQSTLLSFLVVSLFYSSSLHDIVFRFGVSFFIFLVGFCLVFFRLLLSLFSSLGILFFVLFFLLLFC